MQRRRFVLGVLAAAASACIRPEPRATLTPPSGDLEQLERWRAEGRAILQEADPALRTFDVYAAYRLSTAADSVSDARYPGEPAWYPPKKAALQDAMEIADRLQPRGVELHRLVTTSLLDDSVWRERRQLADITIVLADMTDALKAYRDAAGRIAPRTDGSEALPRLLRARARWTAAADGLGVVRYESMGCV